MFFSCMKFKGNTNNNKIAFLLSQRECSYFMSLLDHLWILSVLVVLLDLEVPNTIDTIYLNYRIICHHQS